MSLRKKPLGRVEGQLGVSEAWWGRAGRAWDPPHCPTRMTAMAAGPEDRKGPETGWEGTRLTIVRLSETIYQRSEPCGRSGVTEASRWD